MADQELLRELHQPDGGRIILLVVDGLGGLERRPGGETELETAVTPHLDALAREGTTGLLDPVQPGITPGSGPGHLALFGYDPVRDLVGRGVLAALGVDFPLREGDVAARGNFCTLGEDGAVVDRRAGRPPTRECERLVGKLRSNIELDGAELMLEPVKEHRLLLVLRGGSALDPRIQDTDPHREGAPPLSARPLVPEAEPTADLVNAFQARAREVLAGEDRANMVLLRGFASLPQLPSFAEVYGLSGCAIAAYPMYRGLASLLGMEVARPPRDLEESAAIAREMWDSHDFFFLHFKPTDSAGEDGDFDEKVRRIEEVDGVIPELLKLEPDVLIVTGDHSSPARLAAHSWHPVPVVLHASTCLPDEVTRFGERACQRGGMGRLPSRDLMGLALAHARRLKKFGA